MQGSDEWPAPTAPRQPETRRERARRAAPAIVVALALHAAMAWWLLRAPAPWQHAQAATSTAQAIEIDFFQPIAPEPAVTSAVAERVDAIPFPTTRPTLTEAATEIRETPRDARDMNESDVSADRLFGDIAGVAADLSRPDVSVVPRSQARLPGRNEPFSDARVHLKPPPMTPEQIATAVARMLVSTTAANSTTGLMGTIPGRDPLREMQSSHHGDLNLPRGCDDPENPNLSDECLGIPKR